MAIFMIFLYNFSNNPNSLAPNRLKFIVRSNDIVIKVSWKFQLNLTTFLKKWVWSVTPFLRGYLRFFRTFSQLGVCIKALQAICQKFRILALFWVYFALCAWSIHPLTAAELSLLKYTGVSRDTKSWKEFIRSR